MSQKNKTILPTVYPTLSVGEKLVIERALNKQLLEEIDKLKNENQELLLEKELTIKQYLSFAEVIDIENQSNKQQKKTLLKNQASEIIKLNEVIFKLRQKILGNGSKNIKI